MIQICYSKFHIGDRKFGEKEPFENKEETGGLCPTCLPLEKADINAFIERQKMERGILKIWEKGGEKD